MRNPALFLIAVVYAYGVLAGLAVILAWQMPVTGVSVQPAGGAVELEADGRRIASLRPDAVLTVSADGRSMRLPAGELVADYSPRGHAREVAAWFDTRTNLAALISSGGARLTLPDGRSLPLIRRARRLADLPIDSRLLLAQGALLALLGGWLATVRTHDWGARLFSLSCAGMAAASVSGAIYDARELTADGTLLHALQTINFAASYLGAAALAAIFAVQPRVLVRPRHALAAIVVATAWGAATGNGVLPLSAFYLGLLVLFVTFPVLLVVQAIHCRTDPAARAALRWVGVTTMLGAGQVTVAMAAPKLFDLPEWGGDGSTIIPFALVYGGLAFGIGPHRLFELERWTYRVVLAAAAVLALLMFDATLVTFFDLDQPVAFALALAVAGTCYLPLRGLIWARIMGADRLPDGEKFQLAAAVAYAPSTEARREGWRRLLARLFDPLAIEPASDPVAAVTLLDGGAALAIPAVADDGALRLAFRARGTRLFGRDQLRLAEEMVALMRRADATRAEYARGVGEERQRIARDLHDDVCAMLLTSLHRDDVGKVRGDVRNAMADIRTMIGELTGERVTLDRALADLRFETAERLAAAGLTLAWPLPETPYPAAVLDYSAFRALVSTVREAISNTLKHARATHVTVAVTLEPDRVALRLADDGVGLPALAVGSGRGIANMRARMAAIGGSLRIDGAAGTVVALAMPLRCPSLLPLEPGMGLVPEAG